MFDGNLFTSFCILRDIGVDIPEIQQYIAADTVANGSSVVALYQKLYIQGVTGGTDQTSGECSLGQTIPI